MFYVDQSFGSFNLTVTLGSEETETPPALSLWFKRKGTNNTDSYAIPALDVTGYGNYVSIANIPTNIFAFTGQYDYTIFNVIDPLNPVEIESGLFQVVDTPITKTEYGTDRERGEYKEHL